MGTPKVGKGWCEEAGTLQVQMLRSHSPRSPVVVSKKLFATMSVMEPFIISEAQTLRDGDKTYWRRGDADGSGTR